MDLTPYHQVPEHFTALPCGTERYIIGASRQPKIVWISRIIRCLIQYRFWNHLITQLREQHSRMLDDALMGSPKHEHP